MIHAYGENTGIFIGHIDLLQSGRKARGNNGGARYDSKRSKKDSG